MLQKVSITEKPTWDYYLNMNKKEVFSKLENAYFSKDMHEKYIIRRLPSLLGDGKFFVDISASLGQYTHHINKIMTQGKIIAVEADPFRFERLSENCRKWSDESSNSIDCISAAVSDEEGRIAFYVTDSQISGALYRHSLHYISKELSKTVNWREIEVDAIKLDSILQDRTPDLIKIDVEVTELRVLRGARKLIKRGTTLFLIEVHDFHYPLGQDVADDVIGFMKGYGYYLNYFHGRCLFSRNLRLSIPLIWAYTRIPTLICHLGRCCSQNYRKKPNNNEKM